MNTPYEDDKKLNRNEEVARSSSQDDLSHTEGELTVPSIVQESLVQESVEQESTTPLTVAELHSRIVAAHTKNTPESSEQLMESILRDFNKTPEDTPRHLTTLEALLLAANTFFRTPEADDQFISVMQSANKAMAHWVIPNPEFNDIRFKWYGFVENLLQREECDFEQALNAKDELRVMGISCLFTMAKRLLEIDADRRRIDVNDLSFLVAEGCRAITNYLVTTEITAPNSNLLWTLVGELGDVAALIAISPLEKPLLKLFERVSVVAGYEEEFLPIVADEDSEEEDSLFSESLEVVYREEADSDREDEEFEELQKLELDDELEEVPEEELGPVVPPSIVQYVVEAAGMPDAEYGMQRVLFALAKCQAGTPGDKDREHLWSCALSSFDYENPIWSAGLLGMWISNEERAKEYVRTLLLRVFAWDEEEWDGEDAKEGLPDEGDSFALIVELMARNPATAKGLEEVFRDLSEEVQRTISDVCQESLEKGDIPVQWLDTGCCDINKLEAEVARIFTVR